MIRMRGPQSQAAELEALDAPSSSRLRGLVLLSRSNASRPGWPDDADSAAELLRLGERDDPGLFGSLGSTAVVRTPYYA